MRVCTEQDFSREMAAFAMFVNNRPNNEPNREKENANGNEELLLKFTKFLEMENSFGKHGRGKHWPKQGHGHCHGKPWGKDGRHGHYKVTKHKLGHHFGRPGCHHGFGKLGHHHVFGKHGHHGPHHHHDHHGPHGPTNFPHHHGPHGHHGRHGPHGHHGHHDQNGPHGSPRPQGPHDQHGPHGPHGRHGPPSPHGPPDHRPHCHEGKRFWKGAMYKNCPVHQNAEEFTAEVIEIRCSPTPPSEDSDAANQEDNQQCVKCPFQATRQCGRSDCRMRHNACSAKPKETTATIETEPVAEEQSAEATTIEPQTSTEMVENISTVNSPAAAADNE